MGPLTGYRVVELAGLGPAPFAGMMLSDMGAEILRIERADTSGPSLFQNSNHDIMARGRRSVAIDLKMAEGVDTALELIDQADGLIEGFRPGVMERLGLGPMICLKRNPKLVFGRMTGWGQDGPLANSAGHDINYIALSGVLHAIGRAGSNPVPPLNLVGDFGGGGMFLAFGMVCALLEAARSGRGQVVDAAMVDGISTLMAMIHGLLAQGLWRDERAANFLDTACHYYDTYECADGKFVAVGAIEPKFYKNLLQALDLADDPQAASQLEPADWPALKEKFAAIFRTRSRNEWCEILEGYDACFSPVLSLGEAYYHPHIKARGTFLYEKDLIQPAPAPRFSRTPAQVQGPPVVPGSHTIQTLTDWGFKAEKVQHLLTKGAVLQWQKDS